MSFNVVLYTNNSEQIKVDKDLTLIATVTGSLREECSIIKPEIIIEGSVETYALCNYCYIESFHRYYYVGPITSIRTNLLRLTCRCDALSSWKAGIRANKAIIKRQAWNNNLYLNDGSLKYYQNSIVQTKTFPSGFNNEEFVLVVACPAGSAQS